MKNISWLLAGSALCALPQIGFAQDGETSQQIIGLADIIVTAEKREVDLQSLSQPVSAYTAEARQLAGIATLQDLASFTPGLSYSAGNDRVFIRGIGRQTNTNGSDPGISTYTDGIYDTATASVAASDFFIERVEILRGPQGTLYGRNSIGGAINAISKRPTEEFSADIRTTIANYDVFNLEAAVSGSLTSGLRVRVAGGHYEQDKGYFKSAVGNPSEGNRGKRRYGEIQLEADLGESGTAWIKAFTGSIDKYPRTTNRIGGFDFSPYPDGAITPGAGFGYLNPDSVVALDPNPFPAGSQNVRRFSTDTVQREIMRNNFGLAGDITWSFSTFDVKLLGGYQEYEYEQVYELDDTSVRSYEFPLNPLSDCAAVVPYGLCAPLTVYPSQSVGAFNDKSFGSGEITLTSTHEGPLQWVAGAYYYQESLFQATHFRVPEQPQMRAPIDVLGNAAPLNLLGDSVYAASQLTTKSSAVYAQLDYQVSDTFQITGGIRYTHDKKQGEENFRIVCLGCSDEISPYVAGMYTPAIDITPTLVSYAPAEGVASPITFDTATGIATRQLSNSWDAVTGTLAAEWKPSDDQLAFVRYSRGYKSGGFNAGGISARPQTNAEYVNAYEAGYKHKISNRLRANLALYFYDYKDLQVPITVPLADGAPDLTYFYNLKKSKSYGAEIELAWQPTHSLQLMLNYAFSETRVDKAGCIIDGEDKTAQQPSAKPCGLPVGAQQPQSIVGSGLPNVPRHKIAANAQYNIQTGSGIFTLSGSYMWRDSAYASIFNRPYNKMPSYDQVDLRGIWSPSNGSYRIIAYAKNLFNTLGYDGASGDYLSFPAVPTLQPQVAQTYSYTPPRTFGLQLDVMFR